MTGLSVRGGSNGIEAHCEDMTALAALFGAAGRATGEHSLHLHGYLANASVASAAALDPYGAARFSGALLDALDGPDGLTWIAAECGGQDVKLRAAATAYLAVDRMEAQVGPALAGLADLSQLAPDTVAAALAGHPLAPLNHAMVDGSDLFTAVASNFWTNSMLIGLVRVSPDGRPAVRAAGVDDSKVAATPPRDLTGLMSELAHRSDVRTGGDVDIRFVYSPGPNGRRVRHVVVDIPGVDTFNPLHDRDPTSPSADLRAMAGNTTTYGAGVMAAMAKAGVQRSDQVLLIGHSLGGIVAADIAQEATASGAFHITHVITAGSPIAHIAVPKTVHVLSIENENDMVPHLDGASNPDHANQTTVVVHRNYGNLLDNHDMDRSYLPSSRLVDASDDPSVRSFMSGISGFLGGESAQTKVFHIDRVR